MHTGCAWVVLKLFANRLELAQWFRMSALTYDNAVGAPTGQNKAYRLASPYALIAYYECKNVVQNMHNHYHNF